MSGNTPWSHTFDFTLSRGGFAAWNNEDGVNPEGIWTYGIGWQASDGKNPTDNVRRLGMATSFSQLTVTSISINYSATRGPYIIQYGDVLSAGGNQYPLSQFTNGIFTYTWTATQTVSGISLYIFVSETTGSTPLGGAATVTRITLTGNGVNPFLLNDGAECPCNYLGIDLEEVADLA